MMIGSSTNIKSISTIVVVLVVSLLYSHPAFAASGEAVQVENFIRSIIQLVAGMAGLVATGFFVVGGFIYITSTGQPERLDNAKKTLSYSAFGLAIVIAAFVISNIVTSLATKAFGS